MQEQIQSIYRYISKQRLSKYIYTGVTPLELYKWDIALSESLYPPLHTIEIAVRNQLHNVIAKSLHDDYWLINRNSIIIDRLDEHWLSRINKNILCLQKKGKLDEGHLIAELNFGFWIALLSGSFEYKQILWPRLKSEVFPHARGISIDSVRKRFEKIRRLRNRVFHYGSIWQQQDLLQQHNFIIEAIKWIDPALMHIIQANRFVSIYTNGPIQVELPMPIS